MTKDSIGIVALQIVLAVILACAIFIGKKADAHCRRGPPVLMDCHPYPAAGPRAVRCTWPQSKPVNPWAPQRSCVE